MRRVSPPLEVEPLPSLEAARADWTRLAEAAGNPFSTWEWASAWWAAVGRGRRLLLHACRRPGEPVSAILPLFEASHAPVQLVRFVGHGPADQLAPVCAPADRPLAAAALQRVIRRMGHTTLLIADRLPAEEGWRDALGGQLLRDEPSPVLAIDAPDWEAWLAGRSANLRQQVRRRERRLRAAHDVAFRLVRDPAELDEAMATLFALHQARWGDASSGFATERRPFHEAFARVALERGWLRLWIAELDGRPAAAWLGYRFGGAEWFYQSGRDPAFDAESVGFVLLVHTMREAFADGMRSYRFGLGPEPYKQRFASADAGLHTLALGGTVLPLAARAALAGQRRAPSVLRDALHLPR